MLPGTAVIMTIASVETRPRSSSADPVNNPWHQGGAMYQRNRLTGGSVMEAGVACSEGARHPSGAIAMV